MTSFSHQGAEDFRKGRESYHSRIGQDVRTGYQLADQLLKNNFHSALILSRIVFVE